MMKKAFTALAALALAAVARPAFAILDWSDNSLRLQYGPTYNEPATWRPGTQTASDIRKFTFNFTHASGDKLGDTFLCADMYFSDTSDPASNSHNQGATEFYGVLRRGFSLNKMTQTQAFSFAFVRDVSLVGGLDYGTKNNAFASHPMKFFAGPQLAFDVPGFFTVGGYAFKEWNHNGFSHDQGRNPTGGEVEFDLSASIQTAWGIPLGKLPLQFAGFANVLFPKGKDGFGNNTATEIIAQPKLMWDVAKTFTASHSGYELGVGYQYWKNKYGNDNGLKVNGVKVNNGATSNTLFVEAAVHL